MIEACLVDANELIPCDEVKWAETSKKSFELNEISKLDPVS